MDQKTINDFADNIHLTKCTFTDECDWCKSPDGVVYAHITGYEYREAEYYICSKCLLGKMVSQIEHASDLRAPDKKLPF